MNAAFLLLACTGGEPTTDAPDALTHEKGHKAGHDMAKGEHGPGAKMSGHKMGKHDGEHMGKAGGPHDATMHHRFDDVERWTQVFDDPERDAWQKPDALVGALGLSPGQVVADLGAGTGYLNARLAQAVGAEGKVIAVDIEETLVAHMAQRAEKEGTPQVEARLGAPDDPKLAEGEADLVMMVDVYHHIDSRVDYFTRLRPALKPGGRLVIVDFKEGELPVGPPPEARVPAEKIDEELGQAGYSLVEAPELLPYQFIRIYKASS
ncbi:MAG: class I SAM-dependent methyltransferase [Alphaproteobacteria bacterium]|nr:class I SAM-dependent methyltransferase [Alphaproteobacteria bacterium]